MSTFGQGTIEQKILKMNLQVPELSKPLAAYVPAVQTGKLVFTAGQLPMVNGEIICKGILGEDVEIDQAYEAARICTLNALAAVKGVLGDLDQINRIIRVVGYVACTPTFAQQPAVINGASELLLEIFGEHGKHARSSIGVASLPLNAPVEIEIVVEVI